MPQFQPDPSRRPDPDALLKLAKAEEAPGGRLKIFLGYSAGVGKTYAMLEAARRLKRSGVDVVIGYVETHKRAETQALVDGLEIVPRRSLPHGPAMLEEMDLDAVLARRPKVAIVDELAHTNVPGSRHAKRYQDIQELLAAGIDVYSALNIQHLESLNDVVAKVTGAWMRETVPDRVLDDAHEIEVVDIPIGELLSRLREGRVYVADAAERALQNFFTESNLTALRELTFRRAAKRVDTQMQDYLQRRVSGGPVPVGERILVCVGPYLSSAELVRAGKLLAAGLDAEWFVAYVETPGLALKPERKKNLASTLRLAEELGAKTAALSGHDIAEAVVRYARRHNVTKILIGKPLKKSLSDRLRGTVVDRLIALSAEIDVYVINRAARPAEPAPSESVRKHFRPLDYARSFLLIGAATGLGYLTRAHFEATNLVMFYLAAVVASAVFFGRGPSLFAATVSVIAFDFLFIPPFHSFAVSDTQYLLTFFIFFVVALVVSDLATRVQEQARASREREAHTAALYDLSRDLAAARDRRAAQLSLMKHTREALAAEMALFEPEGLSVRAAEKTASFPVNDHETAVADWVFRNGQPAGRGTDTLPGAAAYYLPVKTGRQTYAVFGVALKEPSAKLGLDDRRLLESFTGQAAAAMERILLSEEAQKNRLLEEKEKLQSALFNSISHDLRTPLVSITGALSGMLEDPSMRPEERKELTETAYGEAERLNRLVGNLLDMARLEASAIKVAASLTEVRDVVGSALKELEGRLEDRKVTVRIPEGLPHVPMDFGLMMKVLVNVIDNAIKYAPFGLPIEIDASEVEGQVQIRVLDLGLGIPERDLEQVFDKFYRVKRPQNFEGTGLGLSICRGIVEAHRGRIWAENRPGGGTIVVLRLPIR